MLTGFRGVGAHEEVKHPGKCYIYLVSNGNSFVEYFIKWSRSLTIFLFNESTIKKIKSIGCCWVNYPECLRNKQTKIELPKNNQNRYYKSKVWKQFLDAN